MKLLLESWRKYVTEELLNEVPLADFGYDDYDYPKYDNDSNDPRRGPSVGYVKSKDPGYKEKAIKFFDKTKDLWYIVFLKTTFEAPVSFEKIEEGDEDGLYERLKQMQKDNNWDPNGKYIVVSFPPYDDDAALAKWQIVHDVIGHTIDEFHQRSYNASWQKLAYYPGFKRALNTVHEALPKEMQISIRNKNDQAPDVYAAIFLGKPPAIEKIPKNGLRVFEAFKKVVADFKDQIKEGEFWYFGGWN